MSSTAAVILAAGKSTRMKSDLPKVLHEVCGVPMLKHVVEACKTAGAERVVVVIGHGKDLVMKAFAKYPRITWVEQVKQKGTGHAVLACESELASFQGRTLVIAGDMPLIRSATLKALLVENESTGDSVTLATSLFDDPSSYGRITRDAAGRLTGIVEHADCTPQQREIKEVNVSYYCFDNVRMFEALRQVTCDNAKGEYYITDAVRILLSGGHGAGATASVDQADATGVNSLKDLKLVNSLMKNRTNRCRAIPAFRGLGPRSARRQ